MGVYPRCGSLRESWEFAAGVVGRVCSCAFQQPTNYRKVALLQSDRKSSTRNYRDMEIYTHHTLSVQLLGGFDAIKDLPTDRVRSYLIALQPKLPNADLRLVYEVEFRDGMKYLSLKSNVEVHNFCSFHIDVLVECANQPAFVLPPIEPMGKRAVPLQFSCRGVLSFRPSALSSILAEAGDEPPEDVIDDQISYHWSEMHLSCDKLTPSTQSFQCLPTNGDEHVPFFFCVQVDGGGEGSKKPGDQSALSTLLSNLTEGRHILAVSPPVAFHNLTASPLDFRIIDELNGQVTPSLYTFRPVGCRRAQCLCLCTRGMLTSTLFIATAVLQPVSGGCCC